jgi:hypothetical protein
MKTYIILSLLLFLICTSCENNSIEAPGYLIVLKGYLFQNEKVDSIHVVMSLPFESLDTVYTPVDDATIVLSHNNQQLRLVNIENGYYNYPGEDLSIEEGNTYSIEVNYNGHLITSVTTVPARTTIEPLEDNVISIDTVSSFGPPDFSGSVTETGIEVNWDNPDNSYFFVVVESVDPEAAEIVMGTSSAPGFPGFPGGDNGRPGIFRFRSEPFVGSSYTINSRMLEKYGTHKVKIYSVNEEYANLYENRTQDSRALSEPISNVRNGLGIFTAFSYAEVTFEVKNKYRD